MTNYEHKKKQAKKFILGKGYDRPLSIEIFTYIIVALTFLSCIVSITNNDIYQDGKWINAQWLGQDIVTFFIALPLLWWSFTRMLKSDNIKWMLMYCGILFYFVYTYAFFVLEAHLTILYFFHLPIFSLSIFSLLISLKVIFDHRERFELISNSWRRVVIVYLVGISIILIFLWLTQIFSFLFNPDYELDFPNGEAPIIIYTLDLALVIPLMLMSAALLYLKSRSGYVMSSIMLIKSSTLGIALMAMSISLYIEHLETEIFLIILWSIIGILGSFFTIMFLRNLVVSEYSDDDP